MKILTIHADYLKYKPIKKALKNAEDVEKREYSINECLIVFTAIERSDEANLDEITNRYVDEIKEIAKQVSTKTIVLYPYAHLSPNLALPDRALIVLKKAESVLKKNYKVFRAPFGWYKSLEFKAKGHPLSELSREINLVGMAEVKKPKGKEKFLILTKDGEEFSVRDYKFKKGEVDFKILVEKEAIKKPSEGNKDPLFIKFLKKYQIDWEKMSDKGHMRFGPDGTLIYDLISDYVSQIVSILGMPVYNVRGTNMFSLNEKAVKEHADLFGDRLYSLKSDNRDYVMRYAACHQQFAMIKEWMISYKNLPFGAFEIADSYRYEQSGELLLSFRTRRMNMPDLHVFCRNMEEAEDWFSKLHDAIYSEIRKLNRDYEMLVNFSSDKHYKKHKGLMLKLLKRENKQALLHFYPEGINYYWTVNIEYIISDELKRPREIATVQIDVGNAERFDIKYTDKNGKQSSPVILHCAILGTIERYLYTLADNMVRQSREHKNPTLPLWLCPIQVRIIPVSTEKHLKFSEKLADTFENENIRVDIDDHVDTVSRRIVAGEEDLIPYLLVVGEKEVTQEKLMVRSRSSEKQREMIITDLIAEIKNEVRGMPFRPSPIPRLRSKRPVFV